MRTCLLISASLMAVSLTVAGEPKKSDAPPRVPATTKRPAKPTLPPGTPSEQVAGLIKHFEDAHAVFRKQYEAAKTAEEQEKLEELFPDPDEYATLLIEVAEKNAKDPAAFEALLWIVRHASRPPQKPETPFARAKVALVRDHLANPKIGPFCMALRLEDFDPMAVGVLRRVMAKNPDKSVQAQAAFALATLLRYRAGWADSLKNADAERTARLERTYGKDAVADLTRDDAVALRKESEELLERLATDKDYAAATIDRGGKKIAIGELAERELFEIRHLQPGKPAPEISGEDIDGKPMKLSDYRGKVVLLDFWGHW